MSYLQFEEKALFEQQDILQNEYLRTNPAGCFCGSTLLQSNTRKYHGLLVVPLEELDGGHHVLLASVAETLITAEGETHIAMNQYPGVDPEGLQYISSAAAEPTPTVVYKADKTTLKKEIILDREEARVFVRYTIIKAPAGTKLRIHPFLSFRNIHSLSKANGDVSKAYDETKNGIRTSLYDGYPGLYMQASRKNEFVAAPDWFYNVEYQKEKERGYDGQEDLFVPGFFEFDIKKGQSIVLGAGLNEMAPASLSRKFNSEIKKIHSCENFVQCLEAASEQFLLKQGEDTRIIAGYPWFSESLRETLIALPGLLVARNKTNTAEAVLDTVSDAQTFLAPQGASAAADIALWYAHALQHYVNQTHRYKRAVTHYWPLLKTLLEAYRDGKMPYAHMAENTLLRHNPAQAGLTWMNRTAYGQPVVPRAGFAVEVNALWYNAVKFALELAHHANDHAFTEAWAEVPEKIQQNFIALFWSPTVNYLADSVGEGDPDCTVRPNMIFALSLPHPVLEDEKAEAVLRVVEKHLLTPVGLRTLSPKEDAFTPESNGNEHERARGAMQGAAWPWLLGPYSDAVLRIDKEGGKEKLEKLIKSLEAQIPKTGLGTLSELYDGVPAENGKGAVSYAPSVAEVLRMYYKL